MNRRPPIRGVVEHDRARRGLPTHCSSCELELAPLAWELRWRPERYCSRQCADAEAVRLVFLAEELRRR